MRLQAAEPKRSKFNIMDFLPRVPSEEKIKVVKGKKSAKKQVMRDMGESDIQLSDDDEVLKEEPPMDPEQIKEQWR